MDGLPTELIDIIYRLLPGFITAGVFYALTAFRERSPFERVVQALIFTAVVEILTSGAREVAFYGGRYVVWGGWSSEVALAWSLTLAVALGLILSYLANNNTVHDRLWRLGVTNGSSYPSNWYKAFACEKRWVILSLKGERRLYGWAIDWPDHPNEDHFVITDAEWLLDDGKTQPLPQVNRFIVPARDVEMVEMMNDPGELGFEDTHMALTEAGA